MSFYSDDLAVALNALLQSEVEQSLEERFSQVYPPFDPRIHYQAVLRDELAKDTPLHATPFLLVSNSNGKHALVPSIEVTDYDRDHGHDHNHDYDHNVVMAKSHPSPPQDESAHEPFATVNEEPSQDDDDDDDDTLPEAAFMHPETRARIASWARHTGAMTVATDQVAPTSPMVEPRAYAQSVDQLEMATERAVSESASDDGKCILPDGTVEVSGESGRPALALALALFKRRWEGEEVQMQEGGNRRRSARIAALQLQGPTTYRG